MLCYVMLCYAGRQSVKLSIYTQPPKLPTQHHREFLCLVIYVPVGYVLSWMFQLYVIISLLFSGDFEFVLQIDYPAMVYTILQHSNSF